jgi:hypothetical protein
MLSPHNKPPAPVVSDPAHRHVLRFAPVETIDDPLRREALAAAQGRDLVQERVTRWMVFAAIVGALLFVLRCLVGC